MERTYIKDLKKNHNSKMSSTIGKSSNSQDQTLGSSQNSGNADKQGTQSGHPKLSTQQSLTADNQGTQSGHPKLSTQQSLTADNLESEDSFASGDNSGENPFNMDGTEYDQDPRLVNIHQYFPALENDFPRAVSGRLGEEQQVLKAIAEEDSDATLRVDSSGLSKEHDTQNPLDQPEGSSGTDTQTSLQQSKPKEDSLGVKRSDEEGSDEEGSDEAGAVPPTTGAGDTDGGALAHDAQPQTDGLFSTAVDEDTIESARQRNQNLFTTDEWSETKPRTVRLSDIVHARAYEHYERSLQLQSDGLWVDMITAITKAINLKSDEAVFYCLRGEAYIQLCDFQSAILNYKKACLLANTDLRAYDRLTFLFYFQGQCLFDQRLYSEALESFSRAAEMNPSKVVYRIRSISCLAALQRHGECLALINKQVEVDRDNPDLYIMRARLHQMFRNNTLCYYDVSDALALQPKHPEAVQMMKTMEELAKESKNQALQLNIAGKYREALQKISIAIDTNPAVADFHVLRGALHRRLNDFNAAIDDFLLALDKCDHDEDSPVYGNSQRQLLLTYNDFAVECFVKGYYEEALILLNKAIKGEKSERGLYINRGDCFFKQGELTFAMQDYMQALELDISDTAVKVRISVLHNEFGVNAYQDKDYIEAEQRFTLALQYNPHVGQYYMSRSRTRYMLENVTAARQDLVLGLLLDPTNDDVLSIVARLFPGKSVADIINSPIAVTARTFLYDAGPPAALWDPLQHTAPRPMGSESARGGQAQSSAGAAERVEWKPAGSCPPLALCMQENEFNQRLVHEKRKVELDVKDALLNRRSLRHSGARIQPLPPALPHSRYGGQLKNRVPHVASAGAGHEKGAYNWRTFSLGIGLQDS